MISVGEGDAFRFNRREYRVVPFIRFPCHENTVTGQSMIWTQHENKLSLNW